MEQYVLPILFFLLLGAVAGVLLTVASKLLFVKTDETVEKITEALPGANCGGCGYSGCEGYANAVSRGEAPPNLCKPGGASVTMIVSGIIGVAADVQEREYAYVKCNGNCDVTGEKFVYIGTDSCVAVEKLYNGKGKCSSGCHGLGDCVKACEFNAICIKNGVAVVNSDVCTACGRCVKVCPNHLIALIKESQKYIVTCSSTDSGKITRAACSNGCIACGLCAKKCPSEAIAVSANHAIIDAKKCTGCGTCAEVCPVKCIKLL